MQMSERLNAACEETLLSLIQDGEDAGEERKRRQLRISAHREGDTAILEFTVAAGGDNIQDRLMAIGDDPGDSPAENEISLRLLRWLSTSVRHQRYHESDIVTVRVAAPVATVQAAA